MTGYEFSKRVYSQAILKREISDAVGDSSDRRFTFFLARELMERGYLTIRERQPKKGKEKEKDSLSKSERNRRDVECIANNIRRLFREHDISNKISGEYLCALSKYLNCTTDFLLGLSDVPNEGLKKSGVKIGLRPESCQRLSEYSAEKQSLLNDLIFDKKSPDHGDYLSRLLENMYFYAVLLADDHTAITMSSESFPAVAHTLTGEQKARYLKQSAFDSFEQCLDHVENSHTIRVGNALGDFVAAYRKNPRQVVEKAEKEQL